MPGRVAVDGRAGTMPGPEGTGKRIVGRRDPIGMGGVMRRRQLRVVGGIEDVSP